MKRARISFTTLAVLLAAGLWAPAAASDEEKIEQVVAAVIEAFRTGDYAAMGRYYDPQCTVVSANYNPPVEGWSEVEQRYKAQHASLTGAEMVRENTKITRRGKVAWVTYQWRFAGVAGPQTFGLEGHTTLVLEKKKGRWLIVHNHTSALPATPVRTQSSAAPSPPSP